MWYPHRTVPGSYRVRILHKSFTMKTGDYGLLGYEHVCLIERKGSARELQKNLLTSDYHRTRLALERLARETKHPYLLLDTSPAAMLQEGRYVDHPQLVSCSIMNECAELGIRILWAPASKLPRPRKALGHQLLYLLLSHIHNDVVGVEGSGRARS